MVPVSAGLFNCSAYLRNPLGKYNYVFLRRSQIKAKIRVMEEIVSTDVKPSKKVLAITCKHSELNHYKGQRYDKFKPMPLASKGWLHKKSKGDFFVINNTAEGRFAEELQDASFNETNLDRSIIGVLTKLRFKTPTEIQAIPSILSGRNSILAAETGCGKTLAYLLPIMHHVLKWKKCMNDRPMNTPLAVILSPNRELAHQIHSVTEEFSEELGINCKIVVGGHTKRMMVNPEFGDVDILVGTLGAISKLNTVGLYNMHLVRHMVLDEADSLLDDSFEEKLTPFLKRFSFNHRTNHELEAYPSGVQITLASATMPRGAADHLSQYLPVEGLVIIKTKNLHHIISNVKQYFLRLGHSHKPGELLRLVKTKKAVPTMVFCSKTPTSQWLSMFLNENGVKCLNLNGEMTVEARAGKFDDFLSGKAQVISCTDIGSRGLNTVEVQHVLNYEFPLHIADYIHRCGRTGRLGSSVPGLVSNFISGPREVELVQKIEAAARNQVELPNVNGNIKRLIIHRINRMNIIN